MIEEMDEYGWAHGLDKDSAGEEVEETYQYFKDEVCETSDTYPNGRDYEAEDEDGMF